MFHNSSIQQQAKLISTLEDTVLQEAQISILQRQREANLEEEVRERTKALADAMKDLHLTNIKLRAASSTDTLTGIMNRYACDQYIEEHWHEGTLFAIAMVDADHFKSVNDTHGHDAGDACLKTLATLLTHQLSSPTTRVGRFGGEEFIILAPGFDQDTLAAELEKARQRIESETMTHNDTTFSITVSIGVSSNKVANSSSAKQLIKQADLALYRAKRDGRNRVVLFENLSGQDKAQFEQ